MKQFRDPRAIRSFGTDNGIWYWADTESDWASLESEWFRGRLDRQQSYSCDPSQLMQKAVIENTAIPVSRLSMGTASLHLLFSSVQRQKLIQASATAGITHFDTSPYYGYGLAETDLGVFLRGQRAAYTVTTKVGLYPWRATSSRAASV